MEKQAFINSVKDGAISAMKTFNILASTQIAQAILESGWGESQLTKLANNLFGIKAWGYTPTVSMPTQEEVNGEMVNTTADFRKYNSWSDSIVDHAKFLKDNSRYSNIIGCKDANKVCDLLHEDGYATDSKYADLLKEIISENKLTQYDTIVSYPPQPNVQPVPAYYIVQDGDTLSRIAAKHNTTYQKLAQINHIANPNIISIGQKIYFNDISSVHVYYKVVSGDTLSGIATKYNTTYQTLARINNISDPNKIYVGQNLLIR